MIGFRKHLAVLTLAAVAVGCGPVVYVDQVTRKASASVAAAKAAGADRYAPYHYTLAIEYLHKAREEAAHADYQAANRFGRKSHEAALEAKREAIANAADPNFEPIDTGAEVDETSSDGAAGDQEQGGGLAPLIEGDADAPDPGAETPDEGAVETPDQGGVQTPDEGTVETPDQGGAQPEASGDGADGGEGSR